MNLSLSIANTYKFALRLNKMGWVIMPKAASNPPTIISLLCHNVLYDASRLMNTILLDPVIVRKKGHI